MQTNLAETRVPDHADMSPKAHALVDHADMSGEHRGSQPTCRPCRNVYATMRHDRLQHMLY
jgi:hypothetical protein